MSGPIELYIDDALTSKLEWGWSTSETLGGVGNATLIVQDQTNTWEPTPHADVKFVVRETGWVLWRGEINPNIELELPNKFPWRRWKLSATDYNNQFSQRLVGAFDGVTWIDSSGLGIYVNIDPYASTLATDKLTVQTWLDHYLRIHGIAVDADTFVNQYIDDLFPQDFDYSNLQEALEKVASLVAANLQFWLDPDLMFHWVTIPSWQDLLPAIGTVSADDTASTSAMMFPESSGADLDVAPYDVSDSPSGDEVALSDLKINYDLSGMPEQVYVKGSTGYVYNAPPIDATEETKTTVHSPTAGSADHYEVTLLSSTKLWHVDGTGYVSTSYDTGSGGPYECKWVSVPWSQSRNKGGNYWKLLSGPYEGKLVDDNTNTLNGYGSIRVQKVTLGGLTDPIVGVGGSGWTNEVEQDPDKRQVYLESPISSTAAERNAIGGQAEYRGLYPTLRGSFLVRGFHGWRVGQLVRVTDARLPTALNGLQFVIQEISASAIAGTDIFEYKIGFGDGPESRYTAEKDPGDVSWPPPFIQIDISVFDLSPGPNSTQTITGQLINGSGEPWALPGKVVNWSFECYNNLGVLQTGEGSIAPTVSITDKHGKARTRLTTGPDTSMVYYVFAEVKAT